jgi:hypothetical protein
MPTYLYRVGEERLEVMHSMKADPQTWGELRAVAELPSRDYADHQPVERLIVPVAAKVSEFTADFRNKGLQRLEKRDKGVYENVTAPKGSIERILDSN